MQNLELERRQSRLLPHPTHPTAQTPANHTPQKRKEAPARGLHLPNSKKMESRRRGKKGFALRDLDLFPKIALPTGKGSSASDFSEQTMEGGVLSGLAVLVLVLLALSELSGYFSVSTEEQLVVDTSGSRTMRINFDVVFPRLPCAVVSVDALDSAGQSVEDVMHHVYKKRLDANGNAIGGSEKHKLGRTIKLESELHVSFAVWWFGEGGG